MKSIARSPGHDWMSLVDMSGVMVSEPVLHTFFPEGPKPANEYVVRQLERAWRGYQIRADEGTADAKSRWMNFVYDVVLEIPRENWKISNDVPDSCVADLQTYDQKLVPNRVMVKDGVALLSVLEYFNGQDLTKVETKTGKWKASPLTKIDRLLRETKVQFGLLTNGREIIRVH
ncbi:MAG: hypothetical protein Q7J68_05045 [Thermoplasmata archaeon]|nr:hypothetical protein [Thermoplasmata archaeon]